MKKESSLILDQIDKKLDDISQISSSDILGWFSGKNFCVRLSDEFRFNSLYNNGGIWCDLDCIPLKPFDDRLLANTFFRMKNHNKKQDIFFMGCEPKKLWDKQCYVIENPFYYSDLRSMGTMMKEMKLAPEYVYNLMSKRNTPRDIIDDQYVIHLSIGDKFN